MTVKLWMVLKSNHCY